MTATTLTSTTSSFNNTAKKKKEEKKKRIMVVDDEEDIIFTVKNVLKENGFEVDSFNTAPSALENFKPDLYCVAILDIKMPEMNGFQLYEKIMEIDNKVKVIFLTALSELRDYEGFRNIISPKWGERHFVQKPIENEDLVERVNMMAIMYSNMYYYCY